MAKVEQLPLEAGMVDMVISIGISYDTGGEYSRILIQYSGQADIAKDVALSTTSSLGGVE